MKNIIPAVAILVFKDEYVLLVRHKEKAGHLTGVYGLPAGRIEKNESELKAAKRELEEETGIKTTLKDFIEFPNNIYTGAFKRKDGSTMLSSMRVFICKNFSGELRSTEEAEPELIEISKVGQYQLLPNVEEAILDGLNFIS